MPPPGSSGDALAMPPFDTGSRNGSGHCEFDGPVCTDEGSRCAWPRPVLACALEAWQLAVAADVSASRLWNVYVRVGGSCTYCGRALRLEEAHLDHELGASALAAAPDSELLCSCAACRDEKGRRTGAEYRVFRRMLQAREMLAGLSSR